MKARLITVLAALAFVASTQASPINCQGDQEYYFAVAAGSPGGASQWWTDCGYRYEWPSEVIALPPAIEPPTSPVPESASWILFLTGIVVGVVVLKWRRK